MRQKKSQFRIKTGIVLMTAMLLTLTVVPCNVKAADKTSDKTSQTTDKTSDTKKVKIKDKSFNKNKTITISEKYTYPKTEQYIWIQYKPSADGYLAIRASDAGKSGDGAKGYIALYDSSKTRALSSKSISYNTKSSKNSYWYQSIFGLQKNQVYYFRVKAQDAVKLTCSFKKVNDKSGASKANALNIKKNKSKTGLIIAGNSTVDWYKIRLTKKQKINLYYNIKTQGTFRISIYSDQKYLGTQNVSFTSSQRKLTIYQHNRSTNKTTGLNAGTYYIKIDKANTTSSGYYTLKWK